MSSILLTTAGLFLNLKGDVGRVRTSLELVSFSSVVEEVGGAVDSGGVESASLHGCVVFVSCGLSELGSPSLDGGIVLVSFGFSELGSVALDSGVVLVSFGLSVVVLRTILGFSPLGVGEHAEKKNKHH